MIYSRFRIARHNPHISIVIVLLSGFIEADDLHTTEGVDSVKSFRRRRKVRQAYARITSGGENCRVRTVMSSSWPKC